jgi:hypothetical protein
MPNKHNASCRHHGWQAARRTTPGGQSSYSELAIETGMMLRLAFHLALRQTEGLMASIFGLLGVLLSTPDHSTLSRAGQGRWSQSPRAVSCQMGRSTSRSITPDARTPGAQTPDQAFFHRPPEAAAV